MILEEELKEGATWEKSMEVGGAEEEDSDFNGGLLGTAEGGTAEEEEGAT